MARIKKTITAQEFVAKIVAGETDFRPLGRTYVKGDVYIPKEFSFETNLYFGSLVFAGNFHCGSAEMQDIFFGTAHFKKTFFCGTARIYKLRLGSSNIEQLCMDSATVSRLEFFSAKIGTVYFSNADIHFLFEFKDGLHIHRLNLGAHKAEFHRHITGGRIDTLECGSAEIGRTLTISGADIDVLKLDKLVADKVEIQCHIRYINFDSANIQTLDLGDQRTEISHVRIDGDAEIGNVFAGHSPDVAWVIQQYQLTNTRYFLWHAPPHLRRNEG